jgi:hypothetical protein
MSSPTLAADALKPEQLDGDLLFCSVPAVPRSNVSVSMRPGLPLLRVYDAAANLIETHEPASDFKEW